MTDENRSGCPIATTLDILGDRWTLVVVRDMLNGKKRFSEFLDSPERITASVLTDRLATMAGTGLIGKNPYQLRPRRYEYSLTDRGEALLPMVQEMCRWGNRYFADTWTPPDSFMQRKLR